jgi:hypothetical protein
LPPLSSPKDGPPHRIPAPKHYHRVWYQSFRRRIPSTKPRPETDAGLGLPPNVLRKWYPSGNNL